MKLSECADQVVKRKETEKRVTWSKDGTLMRARLKQFRGQRKERHRE